MINGLREIVEEYASAVCLQAAEALLDDATEDAPEDTGDLKRSRFGPEVKQVSDTHFTATLGFAEDYATFTDEGTDGPYPIRAVNAEYLRFTWPDGPDELRSADGFFYFKEVFHPGIKGTFWFTEAVERWVDYVQDAVE